MCAKIWKKKFSRQRVKTLLKKTFSHNLFQESHKQSFHNVQYSLPIGAALLNNNKDRQCTYNATLRRLREIIVAVVKQYYIFWMCVCSLWYTACNAQAVYYYLWPVRSYHIFPRYLINGTILEKKSVIKNKMYVLIFFTNLSETFLVLRKIKWYMIKSVIGLHVKYALFLSDLNET
jgi:hypothetical protein